MHLANPNLYFADTDSDFSVSILGYQVALGVITVIFLVVLVLYIKQVLPSCVVKNMTNTEEPAQSENEDMTKPTTQNSTSTETVTEMAYGNIDAGGTDIYVNNDVTNAKGQSPTNEANGIEMTYDALEAEDIDMSSNFYDQMDTQIEVDDDLYENA